MGRPNPWANQNNAIKLDNVNKRPCGCDYNAGFSWILMADGNLILFPTTGKDNAEYFKFVIQGANGKETFAAVDVSKPEDVIVVNLIDTVGTNQEICVIFSAAKAKTDKLKECTCAVDFDTKICCGASDAGAIAAYLLEGCALTYNQVNSLAQKGEVTFTDPNIVVGETVEFYDGLAGAGNLLFSYVATNVDAGLDSALMIAAQNYGLDATASSGNTITLLMPIGISNMPKSAKLVGEDVTGDLTLTSEEKRVVYFEIPDAGNCQVDLAIWIATTGGDLESTTNLKTVYLADNGGYMLVLDNLTGTFGVTENGALIIDVVNCASCSGRYVIPLPAGSFTDTGE